LFYSDNLKHLQSLLDAKLRKLSKLLVI